MKPPAPHDLRKTVLIVDDHPYLRKGVAEVINLEKDLRVCCEVGTAREGLSAVAKCRPDAVIVDLSLGEGSGLDLIKDLYAREPKLPVLVFSMHHENLYAERAIRAGARGYVMKSEPVETLLAALRKILRGQIAVSENIVSRLIRPRSQKQNPAANSPTALLSDRELEVFRLYGEGLGTRKIAARLNLAISTIETYRSAIKQKLALDSGTELVSQAVRFVTAETRG